MDISTSKAKKELIHKHTPRSKHLKCGVQAFIIGGLICCLGEALRRLYIYLGIEKTIALTLTSVTLIFIASTLTALGVFDKIARFAGAGTLVPITGFSNAITSEAIDSRSEGYILGVGAKIFTVSGPVLLFGITSGVIYGLIYYIVKEIALMMG